MTLTDLLAADVRHDNFPKAPGTNHSYMAALLSHVELELRPAAPAYNSLDLETLKELTQEVQAIGNSRMTHKPGREAARVVAFCLLRKWNGV